MDMYIRHCACKPRSGVPDCSWAKKPMHKVGKQMLSQLAPRSLAGEMERKNSAHSNIFNSKIGTTLGVRNYTPFQCLMSKLAPHA